MWPKDFDAIDFSARRKTFLSKIKRGVAVFTSAPERMRNSDVAHPYRQDSSFYYLTGLSEPHSLCLLAPQAKHPFHIFVQPKDPRRELWEGPVLGPEAARGALNADAASPSTPGSEFDEAFIAAVQEAEAVYYRLGVDPTFDQRLLRLMNEAIRRMRRSNRALWPIFDTSEIIGEMRLVKSRQEVQRLQMAAHITAEAHINAMKIAKPEMYEYEVEAVLHHAFRMLGAERLGYGSIVASGANACTLHYEVNNRKMQNGDLLLIDAAAEYDYYTADITRTFPVGAAFSESQREIYLAVLRAQKECIAEVRPGKTLRALHDLAAEVLTEELRRLKILKGTTAQILKKKQYAAYFPHGTSHWLGMDVHDIGRYCDTSPGEDRKLQAGQVFTIEPGLYFSPDSNAPAKYKSIGVRIEDDILVTAEGCKVLTTAVPKEVEEIEALRNGS
jgi:Xaa-Pro aminopeptidase